MPYSNSKNLQILCLAPQSVCPPIDGGKESIYGALSALALNANILFAYPSVMGKVGIDEYENIGVQAYPIPCQPIESIISALSATLMCKPYKFSKYSTLKMVKMLDAIVPNVPISAILCHHAHTFSLAKRFIRLRGLNVPIIVREHNIEYELVYSYSRSLAGLKRIAATFFAALTRREELRIWREANAVLFLSDQDFRTAKAALENYSSHFFLAREGIPIPPRRKVHHPGVRAPLLVLLNPRATQSVFNLKEFIYRYWRPLVEKNLLDGIELHITGVNDDMLSLLVELDSEKLRELHIRGLGFVYSLTSTFKSALALVSPTFVGGGIRKKVLEAMSNQLPVIATDVDIASCDYFKEGDNILSLKDLCNFVDTVQRLRHDKSLWFHLSEHGRCTVEEFASWNAYGDDVTKILSNLADHNHKI